mmetsp:Transcript_1773/g.5363  ORF Transcript_1773/g.5363 Transcript_1773/m.5363 type:complete len:326 (+) Transcript_1773:323-1300(+)
MRRQPGAVEQLGEVVELRAALRLHLRLLVRRRARLADELLELRIDPHHVRLLLLVAERAHRLLVRVAPPAQGRLLERQRRRVGQQSRVERLKRHAQRRVLVLDVVVVAVVAVPVVRVLLACAVDGARLLTLGAHQLVEVRLLARLLLELAHDCARDVVQLALRRAPLRDDIAPQPVDEPVDLLVKVGAEFGEAALGVGAVGHLILHPLLVLAHRAQQPRAVRCEHLHVVHLVLEPLLQHHRKAHDPHVRRVLLLAVLARVVHPHPPLHVHLIHGTAEQRAHAQKHRRRDEQRLEHDVLADDVRALLVARANLGGGQQREGAGHHG